MPDEGQAYNQCTKDGCVRPVHRRGLCNNHYQQWWVKRPDGRPCGIDECPSPVYAKNVCVSHWRRLRKYGDPLGTPTMVVVPEQERFWARVDQQGPVPENRPDLGPCWLWTIGLTSRGYGQFRRHNGPLVEAHIYSFETERGAVPIGLELDHLCRVHNCVRPSHMEAVTHFENLMRGMSPSAINARKTECMRGHPFDIFTLNTKSGNIRRQCSTCRKLRSRS